MKTLNLLIIALVTIFMASCGKEGDNLLEVNSASVQGSWELRQVLGIQIAGAPTDFKAGNGNLFEFDGQQFRRVTLYEKRTITTEGTFEIVEVEPREIDGTEYRHQIIFNVEKGSETLDDLFFRLSSGRLVMSSGTIAADGTTLTFEKI